MLGGYVSIVGMPLQRWLFISWTELDRYQEAGADSDGCFFAGVNIGDSDRNRQDKMPHPSQSVAFSRTREFCGAAST